MEDSPVKKSEMKRLVAVILGLGVATTLLAVDNSDGKRWWSYVEALASDQMQGRNTGSAEHRKAADYVVSQFERAGLEPAAAQGYIQPVKFDARRIVEAQSSLELIRNGQPERLVLGEDAVIALRVDPAESVEAPLVFAGYGLVVPEAKFDDLAALDLKGKIIVTIGGGPSSIPGNLTSHYGYATERGRFLEQAGVIGLVTIQNPRTSDIPWSRSSLARLQESMSLADPALVDMKGLRIAVTVNAAHADKWLAGSGHSIGELLALVDAGKPLPHFPLTPSLKAKIKVERRQVESQNVMASLPGSDPSLRNEYVVLTAHLDHLGVAEPIDGDRIYNGAMDDAAGVASLLDIAQTLHETNTTTRRSLLFVAVTGEEKGLLGSRYFAAHPTVDPGNLVADLNLDMFLPLYPLRLLTVYGLNESDLGDDVRQVAKAMNVELQDDPAPQRNVFVRSDQYNFIRHGIPAVMTAFGNRKGSNEEEIEQAWLKNRYHAPSDDLKQPIDLRAAAEYNRFMRTLAETVANNTARPQWKAESFFRRFSAEAGTVPIPRATRPIAVTTDSYPLKERLVYGKYAKYAGKFNQAVDALVRERWLIESDGRKIKAALRDTTLSATR
jgi:Zn-dependent M28 family amino/carboxypeptidase